MRRYPKYYPPFSEYFADLSISDKIFTCLLIGIAIPAFFSSPFGLYNIARGLIRYSFKKTDFEREIKRLQKSGYVALTKNPDGITVKLLKKGRKRQDRAFFQTIRLKREPKWDRKWRLYIFDIPEEDKPRRDLLRMKLKELGMYNIQRSVFAYPYDCCSELGFISDYYNLTRYTTYAEVVQIDIDKELRKYFKL